MCHRYTVKQSPQIFAELGVSSAEGVTQQLELFPTKPGPVIVPNSGGNRLESYEWGLLPFFWKPTAKSSSPKTFQRKCFNARSETVHEKPSFRQAFAKRRCLVPATEFFEKDHWFALPEQEAFCFAGLWEHWQSGENEVYSYTILTTRANAKVEGVGHPRMPVLLHTEEQRLRWLNPDIAERGPLEELMRPVGAELLTVRPHAE